MKVAENAYCYTHLHSQSALFTTGAVHVRPNMALPKNLRISSLILARAQHIICITANSRYGKEVTHILQRPGSENYLQVLRPATTPIEGKVLV